MSNISSAVGCFPTADEAFGPVVDSCRNDFDFTIAFEQYFFTIAPAALLLISAPLRLRYLGKLPSVVPGDWFRIVKLGVVVVFAVFQVVLVALWASQSKALGQVRTASVAASSVSLVSSLAFCALSYSEHVKSRRPSSILNAYLLVSLIFDGAILRTLWLTTLPTTIRAIFTTLFALKAMLLLLEAKEKRASIEPDEKGRNPEITSGLYSRGLFWWMNPLLKDGFGRLLKPVDLYSLDAQMRAELLNQQFWHTWNRETSTKGHNLIMVCVKMLKWQLLGVVAPRLCLLAFTICQPLLLNRFLSFLQNPAESINIGYGLIAAYGLVYLGIALSSSFYRHQSFRTVTMLRGVLVSAVFTRSTSLSTADIDNSAAVTLMSTDVDAIVRAMREIHEFWANIIQIALAAWLLSVRIGFACIGPIIVCVVSLAATVLCSKPSQKYMLAWVEKVQERIGITSTMLGHMKAIKMSGLGPTLTATIASLRVKEIDAAKPFRVMSAITSGLAQVPVLISPVVAFAFFTITSAKTGDALDATRMFSSLSLIILLGQPLFWMFETVLDMSAAYACFKRIETFLVKSDRADNRNLAPGSSRDSMPSPNSSTAQLSPDIELHDFSLGSGVTKDVGPKTADLVIRNASLSWKEDGQPILTNINLEAKAGTLTMITGSVAAGKTTLLKGLLGEVPVVKGDFILRRHRLAWCEQSAWLINDTIRNNIIGFSSFDAELYRTVVRSCDLDKDFSRLVNGDETLVGSKGISLSGGQKQRVALARAVYSRPQLALFDDVFSGLDNHTAKTIFERLFDRDEGLLRKWGTTVVIATQAVRFLPYADQVTVLKDGTISECGTFDELVHSGGYIQEIYKQPSSDDDQQAIESVDPDEENSEQEAKAKAEAPEEPGDKRRQRGDFTVYKFFFGQVGLWLTVAMLVVEISWAFLESFPTVWLNFWAAANDKHPNERIGYYLGVYAALQVLAVLAFGLMVMVGLVYVAAQAGLKLHQSLLETVMWAPLSLFTKTDIGSITTRSALLASSTGYLAICFPFLVMVFYLIQKTYLRTSRQLRFLDLEEKAPVYTQFLETLSGLPTIRAFGWGKPALELNHKLVDKSQRPFYLLLMLQQWLTLVLDLVVTALALLIVGLAVRLRGSVSVGLTGVSLVQLISFAETLKLLIQFWTSLETSIGAVARIKNFREETPDERLPGENHTPTPDWPASGAIDIRGVSASYGEDLAVKALDGISLSFSAGQKIGICGRTGSGKSSLLLALLRLLDLSAGSISIDGIDLSTLPREEVRSRLIAITQDSFFLPGTVRQNIDPYGAAGAGDDDAIGAALRKVGLWEAVEAKGGLDAAFEEDMLSHGQKQLFSLARAMLRSRGSGGSGRVVLFDEATSSVDHRTDALMQAAIRDEFRGYTVVSVAHRLETVADFDRVVVLEKGCLVEEGSPQALLASGKGKFKELWDASRRGGRSR